MIKGISYDGKQVKGQYIIYDGLNLVLVNKTAEGITKTAIKPDSLEECATEEGEGSNDN